MSRGFIREEDQEEIPIVPPRADLPEGEINYVTQVGWERLLQEKEDLLAEIGLLDTGHETEHRIAVNHIHAKIKLLNERLFSAKVIDLKEQPPHEVRFGATVTVKVLATGKLQKFQIVGVDEADITQGKIAYLSPLARSLNQCRIGETAVLRLAREERKFEIMDIAYGM